MVHFQLNTSLLQMNCRDIILTTPLQSTESLIYLSRENLYLDSIAFPFDSLIIPSSRSSGWSKLTVDLDGWMVSGLQFMYFSRTLPRPWKVTLTNASQLIAFPYQTLPLVQLLWYLTGLCCIVDENSQPFFSITSFEVKLLNLWSSGHESINVSIIYFKYFWHLYFLRNEFQYHTFLLEIKK